MPARHKTGKNVGKTKKGHQRLAGRKRKGTEGNAANFMTRQQAVKKLQVTLPEFRKLCILHGIYPREPRKAPKGKNKTYFYVKDIQFLAHDTLISQFRAYDSWKQKITKAQHKKENSKVKTLVANKPKYRLDHVILQRYPTFEAAVEELDDALNMVFLFGAMAQNKRIRQRRIENCMRLAREWEGYVAHERRLRKTFISIKGVYFQADILGKAVTWMVPHQFTYSTPKDVDLRVMLSFLEFYESLLGFVLYKLYADAELSYPPQHIPVGNTYPCGFSFKPAPAQLALGGPGEEAGMDGPSNGKGAARDALDEEERKRVAAVEKRMGAIARRDAQE
eukprot:CAMPEP_0119122900 /NCGR_PEP_ID=MMETSP1310-20130426/3019_1 /TAXON_ID=464262 /ORGANISM="Genus nov. species nov., Strain RCC2339" /LENGTH=334 /DNA_ID=CAMNT_0007112627 /DNA_START=86 /DNA_END=1087 /DNA_ORIENTATION=+